MDDAVTKHCEKLSIPTDGISTEDLRKTLEERTWCGFRMTRCLRSHCERCSPAGESEQPHVSYVDLSTQKLAVVDALSEQRLRAAESVYADVATFVGRRARVSTLEAQLATDPSNLSVAELAECFPQSFEVFVPKGGKDEWA